MLCAVDLRRLLERHGLRGHRHDVRKVDWHGSCGTYLSGTLKVVPGLLDLFVRNG